MANSLIFDLIGRDRGASAAFSKVGRSAADAGKKINDLGRKGDGLSGHFTAISRTGSRSFGFIATGAKAAGLALGAAAVSGAAFGLKTAASMEQARISFTTMLGSAQKADTFLKQLQQFAAATPFGFPELQSAASSLISVGINAKDVIPIMTTLGDVTSGMGTGSEGVQRATIALQQMSAAGKITGEDLNQLRDAGVPVFDLLSAATGKTKAQVVALAQSGKLGSKELGQLFDALKTGKGLERFNGLMQKQSQSLSGLFSTLKDNVSMTLSNLITPAIPAIKFGLGVINNLTSLAAKGLTAGFGAIGKSIGIVVSAFKDPDITSSGFNGFLERVGVLARQVANWFTGTFVPGLHALVAAFKEGDVTSDGFVGAMERIGVFARQTGQFIQQYILPPLARFGEFIRDQVLPALGRFLLFIGPVIGRALAAFGHWIMGTAVPALQRFGGFIRDTVIPAAVRLGGFLAKNLGPTFVALGQFIVQRVWPALRGLFERFQQIWPTVQRVIVIVAKLVGFLLGLAVVVLGKVLPVIIKLAGPVLTLLFAAIGKIIGIAVKLISTFITAATWLVSSGKKIITGLVNGLVAAWRTVTTWLTERKKAITDRFAAAVTWLVSAGRRILGGLWDGLKAIWVTVSGWIGGIGTSIRLRFARAGGWLYDKGKAVLQGFWDGLTFVWKKITGWISGLTGWIKDHKGPPSLDRNLLVQAGKDIMGGFERGLKNGGLKALGFVQDVAGNIANAIGAGQSTSSGAMQSMVAGYASMLYGWTGSQWTALKALLMGESGFNPNAQNPTSSAYGLFQFLDSTWGFVNAQKTSNPQGQTLAGLRYIKQVYGNPVNAFSAWLNRTPHWYGTGLEPTMFNRPTLIGVGERGPEMVSVTPQRMLQPGRGGGAGNTYNISVAVPVGANPREVGRQLVEAIRAYEKGSGAVLAR